MILTVYMNWSQLGDFNDIFNYVNKAIENHVLSFKNTIGRLVDNISYQAVLISLNHKQWNW